MQKRAVCLACLLLSLCMATAIAQEETLPKNIELYYFYDNLCASCDGTEAFDAAAQTELADVRELYPYDIYRINVFKAEGKQRFESLCAEMGMDSGTITLPVLFAGGRVFQGDETIKNNLREAFLVAGEDLFINERIYTPGTKKTGSALFEDYPVDPSAITVVYFYRLVCEECQQVAPIIDALEGSAQVLRINTRSGNNGERISAFFEAYQVPDEHRMVPIVFTATEYFPGHEAIAAGLHAALENAEPGFVFPTVD